VSNRTQRTKKELRTATPKRRRSIAELKAASHAGDRKAQGQIAGHHKRVGKLMAHILRAWDERPIELKRLESKAAAEPDSQFAESFRQLEAQFDMFELMQFLRIAQEKRKKGAPVKDRNRKIFAEFDQCKQIGARPKTVARAKKYGVTQGYLQKLHQRWNKKLQTAPRR
jgi:hypothetical protein